MSFLEIVESFSIGETVVLGLFLFGIISLFIGALVSAIGINNLGFGIVVIGFVLSSTTLFPLISIINNQKESDKDTLFNRAYVAYFAYDDKTFDESELETLEGFVSRDLFEELSDGDLSDSGKKKYVDVVNDLINDADPSNEKLSFKEYVVVDRGQEELANLWEDGKLDDKEYQLIEFAGELVSLYNIAEDIKSNLSGDGTLSESKVKFGLEKYNNLLASLRVTYDRFDVSDVTNVGSSSDDSFYNIED